VRFLLDTNILIPAEPTRSEYFEATTPSITAFLGTLSRGGHRPIVHPASIAELRGDRDAVRARTRQVLLEKYPVLDQPPALSTRLVSILGQPEPNTNSYIDLLLLTAVEANAVDYLVTEDDGIHRRARRCDLGDRVLSVADATVAVQALFPTVPEAPPRVSPLLAYQLDERDPIFTSFRTDYPRFDDWLAKCKREHRQAWVIAAGTRYAGVCIVKDEPNALGLSGKTLKLCSFKIDNAFRGHRYGELLLKAVFAYAQENSYQRMFVEVFPKHEDLHALLVDFGFKDITESPKGERVLLKAMSPPTRETECLGPLDFNVRYGPFAITLVGAQVFVVPIQPRYHGLLLPEAEPQLLLPMESHPFGNSIRKAYLSHSKIRRIAAGDAILFYRSGLDAAVTAIGVAEGTLVTSDPHELARYVARRTVYSFAEIQHMAAKQTLAVRFRLARTLKNPWKLDLLIRSGILLRAPQSFMQARPEAVDWIASQLRVPH
jgi:GNAT superfamily N-acetyltransferase